MANYPVVLTSGYSETLAEGRGSEYDLLRKPYSAEALSRLIRKTSVANRQPRRIQRTAARRSFFLRSLRCISANGTSRHSSRCKSLVAIGLGADKQRRRLDRLRSE